MCIRDSPNAGVDGTLAICGNSAPELLFSQLGGGAQGGGTWTAPGGGAHSGTYIPAANGPGVYTYSVPGIAPCPADQSIVTVTEPAPVNAGTDGALALCANNTPTNLQTLLVGAQAGGSWTDAGGAVFSGSYDPLVNTSGVYTYTVTGTAPCPNDVAIVTVTENQPPIAGADGVLTVCSLSLIHI